jgi:hypothetical protein
VAMEIELERHAGMLRGNGGGMQVAREGRGGNVQPSTFNIQRTRQMAVLDVGSSPAAVLRRLAPSVT